MNHREKEVHELREQITKLRSEVQTLRAALEQISAIKPSDVNQFAKGWVGHCQQLARAALAGVPQ